MVVSSHISMFAKGVGSVFSTGCEIGGFAASKNDTKCEVHQIW